jgi:hypothetical protein
MRSTRASGGARSRSFTEDTTRRTQNIVDEAERPRPASHPSNAKVRFRVELRESMVENGQLSQELMPLDRIGLMLLGVVAIRSCCVELAAADGRPLTAGLSLCLHCAAALGQASHALRRLPCLAILRCAALRCDAMRCDAMRCDAMRCDAPHRAVLCYDPLCPTHGFGEYLASMG